MRPEIPLGCALSTPNGALIKFEERENPHVTAAVMDYKDKAKNPKKEETPP